MNRKSELFSIIMITLGVGLLINQINIPEQIITGNISYDNLSTTTAGCLSIIVGIITFILTTIISKEESKGAYYAQKN